MTENISTLPQSAEIIERIQESQTIFSLRLRFIESQVQDSYQFQPGQFNMLYLFGVGEVAISIVSDPRQAREFTHTIRAVGRVTRALEKLQVGDQVGIRGAFGRGWPLDAARSKEVLVITGGLGCAPVVGAINYITERIDEYAGLKILQGVKHSNDFIFANRYQQWYQLPKTEVMIAADAADKNWPWQVGRITDNIRDLSLAPANTVVMMCGPEKMMQISVQALLQKNIPQQNIYISMERNMECGIGHCGHCQYGGLFICKNGPVFPYPEIKSLFDVAGF